MWTAVRSVLALAMLASSVPSFAADAPPAADPMAGWKPPHVKAEAKDRKELQALFQRMEAAGKKGDLEAGAALIDFPVLMVTDDAKGEASAESWTREKWLEVMKPFYAKPMEGQMRQKPTFFLVTDSLATASVEWKMTTGGKTMAGRNALVLVRKGGEWKVKAMMEGGWGDMPMPSGEAPVAK